MVERMQGRRVVVVGDVVADEFIYGRVARVSREAPVLILEYDSTVVVAGGAGNAANNVAALGGRARPVGVVGRDDAGRRLIRGLHTRVSRAHLKAAPGVRTPTKTRILAGGVHSAKQQVVRIDRDTAQPANDAIRVIVRDELPKALSGAHGVIVSDYGSGLITPALVEDIRARVQVPVLIDSRYQLSRFRGVTACTPNESEVEHVLGCTIGDDLDALERAGRTLLRRTAMHAVLITRGSRGMALFEPKAPTLHIPIFGSDEIADVTGAGDTVIATLTLALAAGASLADAARLANYAGGLVVMKRGTATVSSAELREAIARDRDGRA